MFYLCRLPNWFDTVGAWAVRISFQSSLLWPLRVSCKANTLSSVQIFLFAFNQYIFNFSVSWTTKTPWTLLLFPMSLIYRYPPVSGVIFPSLFIPLVNSSTLLVWIVLFYLTVLQILDYSKWQFLPVVGKHLLSSLWLYWVPLLPQIKVTPSLKVSFIASLESENPGNALALTFLGFIVYSFFSIVFSFFF